MMVWLIAKCSGQNTNYSLRAASASGLFQAGLPEKLIQDVTGHSCSTECPTKQQRQSISLFIQGKRHLWKWKNKHCERRRENNYQAKLFLHQVFGFWAPSLQLSHPCRIIRWREDSTAACGNWDQVGQMYRKCHIASYFQTDLISHKNLTMKVKFMKNWITLHFMMTKI